MAWKSVADGAVTIIGQIINPLTITGFVIYILAALCYIVALRKMASDALVAVLAHLLWNEPLSLPQITVLALIGSGWCLFVSIEQGGILPF
jgi:hypothetical protein